MVLKEQKIGFIGGGSMGEALLTGILKSGLALPGELYVSDVESSRLNYLQDKLGINTVISNEALVDSAGIVVLAVKPQVIPDVLREIALLPLKAKTFFSIAAGITTSFIESFFSKPVAVVRVMPNAPCLVGEGISAICPGKYAGQEDLEKARVIFSSVGKVVVVKENLFDAVTGLSGSGPAYMYIILEALTDGGVLMGLPREVAKVLSTQTMLGAARMVLETGEHPAKLKDMVTTPGGTTIAGLFALEEGELRATLMEAVEAATERARELSR